MLTEADWNTWTPAALAPYFEVVLSAFGPRRLMFASDWPVLKLAAGYTRWVEIVERWLEPLSEQERARIWGGTAMEAYRLDQ
jgi:L-fuconolactonase